MRSEYSGEGLSEDQLAATPLEQVRRWVAEAEARQADRGDVVEPVALSVATVDADGLPNVRTVLMRFLDERGPGFVTDLGSTKSREIGATDADGRVAHLAGHVPGGPVPRAGGADRARRDRRPTSPPGAWGSRISAWASEQSQPIADRAALVAAYERYAALYPDTGSPDDVPVPDSWGGWRIDCDEVELWAGRRDRLHDRLVFTRAADGGLDVADAWTVHRRQP